MKNQSAPNESNKSVSDLVQFWFISDFMLFYAHFCHGFLPLMSSLGFAISQHCLPKQIQLTDTDSLHKEGEQQKAIDKEVGYKRDNTI